MPTAANAAPVRLPPITADVVFRRRIASGADAGGIIVDGVVYG